MMIIYTHTQTNKYTIYIYVYYICTHIYHINNCQVTMIAVYVNKYKQKQINAPYFEIN